jgi:hypothetical protein
MRCATLALARSLGDAGEKGSPRCFEPFEPRSLLSVPVISGVIQSATVEKMTILVHFAAGSPDDPIVSTGANIGVTGPAGFSQVAQPYHAIQYYDFRRGWYTDGAGGFYGSYDVASPQHFFANGTYTVGVAAGVVHTQHGDANAAGGAGQAYLWFPDQIFVHVGAAFPSGQELWVPSGHWDRYAPDESNPVNVNTLELVLPNGQVISSNMPGTGIRTYADGVARFGAPGGSWDFSDNGTYTVRVPTFDALGLRDGSVVVGQYYLWFGPRAELLGSSFTNYQWSVTIRYTGGSGIDLSSIGNQNAWFNFGGDGGDASTPPGPWGDILTSRFGQLVGTPVVNQNGTVDATYVYCTDPQGLTAAHRGPSGVTILNVRGNGGDATYGVRVDHREIASLTPYVVSTSSDGVTPTSWTITTSIGSRDIDYLNSLFSGGALRIEGPGGVALTPQSVSVISYGPSYRLTYTLTLPSGQHLANGQYHVFLRQGAFTMGGQPTDEVMLGSWWLWF